MAPQNWRTWMQLLIGLGLTFLFFYMMAPFVVPMLLAAIMALLCYPSYDRLQRRVPGWLAAGAVTFALTSGILLPLVFTLISGSQRVLSGIGRINLPKSAGSQDLAQYPAVQKSLALLSRFTPVDSVWFQDQVLSLVKSILEYLSGLIGNFLAGMPWITLVFFVIIVGIYFFLVDGSRFLRFLATLSPLGEQRSQVLYSAFQNSCRGVVVGLVSSALAQGLLILIVFVALGLPDPLFYGVFGIFMGMVPVVGTAPITLGAVLYLLSIGSRGAGIVMLIAFVVITMADNVVRSWVMKGQSEMHPLLALVSAFGATNLMGPPGIFLGPIIAAVFLSFLRILAIEFQREAMLGETGSVPPLGAPPRG